MRRAILLAVLLALLPVGAVRSANLPDPEQTLALVRSAQPPTRDFADLRRRIPVAPGSTEPTPPDAAGQALWVNDLVAHTYRLVPVELRATSEHADWYVEQGREAGDLAAAVTAFESTVLPRVAALTGVAFTPGPNGQPRLAIFNGQTPGVAGYMSNYDALPRSVFPYSNERPIVYLSLDALRPGSAGYIGTLAHELEHLAHAAVNPGQEGWLDEGLAELVSRLATQAGPPSFGSFRADSDVQLNAWSEKPWEARAHYEASHLWSRYLMERGGGAAALPSLVQAGGRGLETADRFARTHNLGGVDDLFRDWIVANAVDDSAAADGRYGYRGLDQRSAPSGVLQPGGVVDDEVHQYAARYYSVASSGPSLLEVAVVPTVPLVGADDAQSALFWSLRGDSLDTRLTRRFDLSGLDRATLRYRLWYALEPDYDFCYTLASADGAVWTPLRGRWTVDVNNVGAALGPGYTGASGDPPAWRDEEVDLSLFAGGPAFVRFECVTDQNYSAAGLVVDDVQVPELGFADDAESDLGWQAEGFVRARNEMAQPAIVLLVEGQGADLTVRPVALDERGHGQIEIAGAGADRPATLVIAGTAPLTLEKMSFHLELRATP